MDDINDDALNNGSGGNKADETTQGEDESTRIKREREEYLEGWKRAKADFLNYKKDEIKRLGDFSKFAAERLIHELIAVLDSFNLALASESVKEDEQAQRGLYLIRQQLEDVLRGHGLRRVEVRAGDAFDPAFHEAIAEVESDKPSGTIVDELEHGYFLQDKLIRPARVKVAK
ncbi:nucleotide exchange factor GrpE [Candidatus Wolfebacteria bacterium]|nr:nucleotide exchange factor GrpE [Candidatus Wolfebacteria bacterium]